MINVISDDFRSDDEINPRPHDSTPNNNKINNNDILEVEKKEEEPLLGRIGLLDNIN